jgi:hypothetical protein
MMNAAPLVDAVSADILEVVFTTISGKSETLCTRSSTSPQDLCADIATVFGIPACSQQWLLGDTEVPFRSAPTMADTRLASGSVITVVHDGFAPLLPLPDIFELNLTSVRQRLHSRCSSAFTILYQIQAKLADNWLYFEPWRKNDHDKLLFDIESGTCSTIRSHWMSGSSSSQHSLGSHNPLQDLVTGWNSPPERVMQDADRFWLVNGGVLDRGEHHVRDAVHRQVEQLDGGEDQARPNYGALLGWFVAPSEHTYEVNVHVPLPTTSKKNAIVRLLIDQEGRPIRAAVKGSKIGAIHEDIEEYDIVLESRDHLEKPVVPASDD